MKFKIAVKRFLVYSEFILLLKMCAWSSGGYKDATKWEDEVGKAGRRGVSWIKRGGLGVPYILPPPPRRITRFERKRLNFTCTASKANE